MHYRQLRRIPVVYLRVTFCTVLLTSGILASAPLLAQVAAEDNATTAPAAATTSPASATPRSPPAFSALPALDKGWRPFGHEDGNKIWIQPKRKQVVVEGKVYLTRGYLEMFACVGDLKAHESVVGLQAKAFLVHTALTAVGAKHGSPTQWRPAYKPASGTTIEVLVEWMDEKSKQPKRVTAQQWVRDLKTKKPMVHQWVFGGSKLVKDPETGKSYYSADSGDLICVSNFPSAMLDLPIQSSIDNEDLGFEALTENVPPRHTPVRVYLIPKLPKAKDG